MKIWEIEEWIVLKIGGPIVLIGIALFIYSRWGQWGEWLWELGSLLLGVALACGIVCMFVCTLLYFGERKQRERLEQEVRELRVQLGKKE